MRTAFCIATGLIVFAPVPRTAEAGDGYVRQLIGRGDYREAVNVIEAMEARTTPDAATYGLLIAAYLHLEQPEKALSACQRGARANPSAGLENTCVSLLRATRPRAETERTLVDALNANPQSPVLQKAVARMLYEDNPQDERAGALLASAARLIPDDAEVHFFFGQWLCLNQREPACIQELTTAAAKTEPSNSEALAQIWSLIATANANMARFEEASQAWERAVRANESEKHPSPWLSVQYVRYLRQTGNLDKAEVSVRKVLRTNPDFGPAHFEAAEVAFTRNDPETAAREGIRALAGAGLDRVERRNIHSFLSAVYASTGRYADADPERAQARE